MYKTKLQEVWASDIAEYLNTDLHGEDVILAGPAAVRNAEINRILTESGYAAGPWLLLTSDTVPAVKSPCYIITKHPERDLAVVIREFFASATPVAIHKSASIAPGAVLGRDVRIGANCVIDSEVDIGDFAWLMNNVIVHGPAKIGKGSVIKDGAVIGSEGYGFIDDENGQRFHTPQLGRVLIGANVWVGANSTIERGMIADTIIQDGVKIDDLAHIGSGSCIGANSMITAGCVIAHDARIDRDVVLAPNVSVRENCRITSGVLVGQGGVVVKNIDAQGVYAGVPAKRIK